MARSFVLGGVYRHSFPGSTYDIQVARIQFEGPSYFKLKIRYLHKATGIPIYIGRGSDGRTDNVRIFKRDLPFWNRILAGERENKEEDLEENRILSLERSIYQEP